MAVKAFARPPDSGACPASWDEDGLLRLVDLHAPVAFVTGRRARESSFAAFRAEAASLGAGLVERDGFLPGWKARGCFYNGNVTNGSAALIVGFGDRIKAGDAVGVYCRRDGGDAGNQPLRP